MRLKVDEMHHHQPPFKKVRRLAASQKAPPQKKRVAFVACFLRISRHFRWLQIGGLHCRPADDDAHVVKTYLSMGSSFAIRYFHR